MAALTRSASRLVRDLILMALVIADSVALYNGSFAALRGPYHATNIGYLDKFSNAKGLIPLASHSLDTKTGDAVKKGSVVATPQILSAVAVTGASDRDDVGKWVFQSSDNDLTLTRPSALAYPVGFTLDYNGDSTFEVVMFGLVGSLLMSAAGGAKRILHLGSFPDLGDIGTATLRTGIPCEYHGRILEHYIFITTEVAGAGADLDTSLQISPNADGSSGVAVTGGAAPIAVGDALGARKDGTAITANNIFHEGDTINLLITETVAQSAGGFDAYAVVECLPGI